jgi:hypothetical protein
MDVDAQQLLNALGSVSERLHTFQEALWRAVPPSAEHAQAKLRVFKELDRVRQLLTLGSAPQFDRLAAADQAQFREKLATVKSQFLDHATKVFLREIDAIGTIAARILNEGSDGLANEGGQLGKDLHGIMVAFSATFTSETVSPVLLRCVTEVKNQVDAACRLKG